MELWIRSQDKIHLMKCGALMVENTGMGYGIRAFTTNYDFNIANYKTKKRALEVLYEIQKLLEDETTETEIRYIDNQEYERIVTQKPNIPKDKVVYEMPEE